LRGKHGGTDAVPTPQQEVLMDENQFAKLLGRAALKVWPDLPRDAQEQLFAAAVNDAVIGNSLATFLHDRHPRTAHPPHPARSA
jgi:hypothetical protein